jgi:Arc/MetJ-type ribon-helix-helix transcriptional regulator
MQVQLDSPELERFITDEVESGRFPSHSAAIAAAVERMMLEKDFLLTDDETVAAIEEAEAQLDRGEGISLEDAFAQLREKYQK